MNTAATCSFAPQASVSSRLSAGATHCITVAGGTSFSVRHSVARAAALSCIRWSDGFAAAVSQARWTASIFAAVSSAFNRFDDCVESFPGPGGIGLPKQADREIPSSNEHQVLATAILDILACAVMQAFETKNEMR